MNNNANNTSNFPLGKQNYILMIIGVVLIIVGLLLMIGGGTDNPEEFHPDQLFSFRRLTLAPVFILGGFVTVLFAIIKKPKK